MKVLNLFATFSITIFLFIVCSRELSFFHNSLFFPVSFGLVFAAAWRFNKSVAAFTSVIVSFSSYGFNFMDGRLTETSVKFLFPVVALNILYLLNKKERGLFSSHGFFKILVIMLQFFAAYLIVIRNPAIFEQTAAFLSGKVIKSFFIS